MKKLSVFISCALSCLFLFSGCTNNDEPFIIKSYSSDGTQVEEINIDVRDREITVSISQDDKIHIDYYENSKEYYEISISDDNILTMSMVTDKGWTDYIGVKSSAENRTISLQIPDKVISSLKLSTTNEDINLAGLTVVDDLSASSNGGDINFEKLAVGNTLTFDVKNGDISGTVLGGYDEYSIVCSIKKGDSNIPSEKSGGEKILDVSANNGDINIEFVNE